MKDDNPLEMPFRDALSLWAATVHVVTTHGEAGLYGFTATSVCSVTDEPPTLLVCINKASGRENFFATNKRLRVNTLHTGDSALADKFAGRTGITGQERFTDSEGWQMDAAGGPRWVNALASFGCVLEGHHNVGSHAILIARVEEITRFSGEGEPLVYEQRRYRKI